MPTLLLVDDDETLARALKFKLTNSIDDLTVVTASNCEDALKIADSCHPEILVVDYWLPDGDGLSLRKQLADRLIEVQTIMISAYWDDFGRSEAEEEHALKVFDKPFDLNELIVAVNFALNPAISKSENARLLPAKEPTDSAEKKTDRRKIEAAFVPNFLDVEEMLADVLNELKNVLIIDPSYLNAGMCKTVFAPYPDCHIELARNGAEAFVKLKMKGGFDLIIVERNLPDMQGNYFFEELTKQGYDHIPAVVVTNVKTKQHILSAMHAGAHGYVIKPWRSSHFRKLLKTVIKEQKGITKRSLSDRKKKMSIPVASFYECYECTE